jgi:NAD(P)-dependent dehydrogenase (short-subunit alcohol dehydrogenase family)
MHSLPEGYRALVIGSGGALGAAFVRRLQADPRCGAVHGLRRGDGAPPSLPGPHDAEPEAPTHATSDDPPFDLLDEASLAAAARRLRAQGPFSLLIVATGALHLRLPGREKPAGPEKRLDQLDPAVLAHSFAVNAIGPALLLKHFHPLLPREARSLCAVLSARVGSIGDNQLGGWYGYRASKAALNQLGHTAAIEIARQRPQAVLDALQPGTVRSPLTAPVIGADAPDALAPDESARRLLAVLDALAPADSGGFFDHAGATIPW